MASVLCSRDEGSPMKLLSGFAAFAMLSVIAAGAAHADETQPAPKKGETWTAPVHIRGRHQRPQAVTEIARVPPTVRINEMRRELVERIERATERDPF